MSGVIAAEFSKNKTGTNSLQPVSFDHHNNTTKLNPFFFHFADEQTTIMSFSNSPKEKHLLSDQAL